MSSDTGVRGDAVVQCAELSVAFGEISALPPTTLSLSAGGSMAIMGPSGSGKSTLLRCVQGLERPTGGALTVLGQNQVAASRRDRSSLRRRRLGLIQQWPDLLEEFSTVENVAFPLLFDGVPRLTALTRGREALRAVGLEERAEADVRTLSGGEAQRVAVARALARPDLALIIADEPTASLDRDNATLITELLLSEARQRGAAVMLATHDPLVAQCCDETHQLVREHERV